MSDLAWNLTLAAGVVAALLILFAVVAVRLGLFAAVVPRRQTVGPLTLVYEPHRGPYKDIGRVIAGVHYRLMAIAKIRPTQTFGVYFDPPQGRPADELRSIGGCILPPGEAHRGVELSERFRVAEFPQTEAIVVEFPFRGVLSILVGAMRVYPQLGKYLRRHGLEGGPVMEWYDRQAGRILYVVAPLLEPGALLRLYEEAADG